MKKNLKNILFTISIFYSLVVVVLMCITINDLVTEVELHDLDENKEKLIEYKEKLSKLPQNSCVEIINDLINHYEETTYDGKVNLNEIYINQEDNSLLSYYQKVKESCNITEEKETKYNLPAKFITASIQWDELYKRYYFQYEIEIPDYMIRLIVDPEITNVEYQINRSMELEIIASLIEIASEEAVINE